MCSVIQWEALRGRGGPLYALPLHLCCVLSVFVQKHKEDCKFQLMKCDQCGQEVKKKNIDQHRSQTCTQRLIRCERCHTEMPYARKMVSEL